jgi:nucleoid-associated protein YgaU
MKRVLVLIIILAVSLSYTHAQEELFGENEDIENIENENVENIESSESNESNEIAEEELSYNLRRNKYFLESLRLKNLANLAMIEGEYDESTKYSEDAMRYAKMSDEYIAAMLIQQRANKAIAEAAEQLNWAKNAQAQQYYPKEYEQASKHYEAALDARKVDNWQDALTIALEVSIDLNGVAAPSPPGKIPVDMPHFPTQYRVRPWDQFGDCLWNISKWFYGTPWKWKILYEANKDKLPDPNNPNLIDIGTVIEIPSINGEARLGMWDSGKPYKRIE